MMTQKHARSARHPVVAFAFAVLLALGALAAASAQNGDEGSVELAVAQSLSGVGASYGQPLLEGVQLAVEEANQSGAVPKIVVARYDDESSDETAVRLARQIVDSRALMVIGPTFSTGSLAAGPIYADGGLASVPASATATAITDNKTTFRMLFANSAQGEALALYLTRVLRERRAVVMVVDNAYGRSLQAGFQSVADRSGIDARYYPFRTESDADEIVSRIAAEDPSRPVVLLTLAEEGAHILARLRRSGFDGPFLGGDSFSNNNFNELFADEPEELAAPGYFTEGLYAISPMVLDSANAEILEFAQRYRRRYGGEPSWTAVAGYDAARLAILALRAAVAQIGSDAHTGLLRARVSEYLLSLDGPSRAVPGLLGPIWFNESRGRNQAVRFARFTRGQLESAPVQIVPVEAPDPVAVATGTVFEITPGRYARLQRVVYSGIYVNSIPHVDLPRQIFGADFYVWLRYAPKSHPDEYDATDIIFPNMVSGRFNRDEPVERSYMADGTEYRLWRVQGEFRNDFDLHLYPFDRQTLSLPFFNARAAADRIVYVVDTRTHDILQALESPGHREEGMAAALAADSESLDAAGRQIASPDAFRNLSQWHPLSVVEQRQNLVTDSALGNLRRIGLGSNRELSGFLLTVEIKRVAIATLGKTLVPLFLMALITFASLYFPHVLIKEKVVVVITGALSGAVLLSAINNQLGAIGYTMAIEYVFYIYFVLCLLCIVSILSAERLLVAGRNAAAGRIDQLTRVVFVIAIVATAVGAIILARSAGAA
jgi:ABC-type branched-subunit amino acid transport system substrate-binding protein